MFNFLNFFLALILQKLFFLICEQIEFKEIIRFFIQKIFIFDEQQKNMTQNGIGFYRRENDPGQNVDSISNIPSFWHHFCHFLISRRISFKSEKMYTFILKKKFIILF